MKKPMKKGTKITLGVLIAVLLIGVCFVSVAVYAKKELNKPRFVLPETEPLPSASPLPENAAAAERYVERLLGQTMAADDTEGSWHTEVSLDGEWDTPLTGADENVLRYIGTHAASLYPSADGVCMAQAEDVPAPMRDAAAVSFTAEQGKDADADRYIITLEKNSAQSAPQAIPESGVYADMRQALSPAIEIVRAEITAQSAKEKYTIDRVTDDLLRAELSHTYRIRAEVRPKDAYRALLPEQETFSVEFPYTVKQTLSFRHYGVRFTQRAVAVQPGDRQSLPAEFAVRDAKAADEYSLTFTPDVQDVLEFDSDGVMTVLKTCDTPVTVTMTLQYGAHTYTDYITVYITELEVESDV